MSAASHRRPPHIAPAQFGAGVRRRRAVCEVFFEHQTLAGPLLAGKIAMESSRRVSLMAQNRVRPEMQGILY